MQDGVDTVVFQWNWVKPTYLCLCISIMSKKCTQDAHAHIHTNNWSVHGSKVIVPGSVWEVSNGELLLTWKPKQSTTAKCCRNHMNVCWMFPMHLTWTNDMPLIKDLSTSKSTFETVATDRSTYFILLIRFFIWSSTRDHHLGLYLSCGSPPRSQACVWLSPPSSAVCYLLAGSETPPACVPA